MYVRAQSYWPFHKEWCKKNDFADMIEAEQPKFAKWMRKHGKIAVLKDGVPTAPASPDHTLLTARPRTLPTNTCDASMVLLTRSMN